MPRQLEAVRFWSRVDTTTGECWTWTGSRGTAGYGQFNVKRDGRWQIVKAHRYAYERCVGPIPAGLLVCHECDNPVCVNPAHLFPGTARDNAHDAMRKGRFARVGEHNRSKTRCRHGHAFTPSNTRRYHGERVCRACKREATRRWRERANNVHARKAA